MLLGAGERQPARGTGDQCRPGGAGRRACHLHFLFERIAYGDYRLRLGKDGAKALGVARDLGVGASLSAQRSVVRLGAIAIAQPAQIASTQ